ncbi:MAG: hypothetical protein IT355_12280 [Gemmatimonadaceae bacterium]|nr:hypothetical protein [Gemmatimonadaceae bacterium]
MADREYSPEELDRILRDAAQLSTDDTPRYSLQEIQSIAAGAEIAPEHVVRAAERLAMTPERAGNARWIEPAGMQIGCRVGRPASASDAMAAIALARQALGETGTVHNVGGGTEWRYDNGFSALALSIVPDKNGTVVRADARADGRQFVLGFGALVTAVATGLSVASVATPVVGVAGGLLALASAGVAARAVWNRSVRATRARLTTLTDSIAQRLDRGDAVS